MKNSIKIRFLGAVETVTGSKYLIQTNDTDILVDCGMFQKLNECLSRLKKKPEKILIVLCELQSADALRVKIKNVYVWNCEIPVLNEIAKII